MSCPSFTSLKASFNVVHAELLLTVFSDGVCRIGNNARILCRLSLILRFFVSVSDDVKLFFEQLRAELTAT